MTLTRSLSALFAAAFSALIAFPASAQDATPAEVAQACVQRIQETVARTTDDLVNITQQTLGAIGTLAENDAPEPVIRRAALEGAQRATDRAHAGLERVDAAAARCVRALRQFEAPSELIEAVVGAAQQARRAINQSLATARAAIRNAADTATSGD